MTETSTTESLSLGQTLKNARTALNLTLDDVATQTNLKKNHIDALENDIFILANVPPTFVRGYVRNYVRFLRLPEELVNSVNYGEVTIPQEVKKAAPIKVSNPKSQTRWVKPLTFLILLGAIGMTLAWWWQEHQKESASRDQLVTAEMATQSSNAPAVEITQPVASNEIAINTQTNNEVVIATAPVVENKPVVEPTPAVEPAKTQSTPAQPEAEQPAVTAPIVTTPAVEQPAVEPSAEPVNVLQQTPSETTATTDEATVVGNDELRIEITGRESWITVRGAKNKRLAEKLYNSGDVLTFNGNEQYRLTIGAPANVKIHYKGQVVPLKIDGRVARIRLPLAN